MEALNILEPHLLKQAGDIPLGGMKLVPNKFVFLHIYLLVFIYQLLICITFTNICSDVVHATLPFLEGNKASYSPFWSRTLNINSLNHSLNTLKPHSLLHVVI